MHKTYLWSWVIGAAFLAGCDKQVQVNTEKIGTLSQKMVQLQLNQAQQLAAIQAQVFALPSLLNQLEKLDEQRFAKSHDEALFYHTNTLKLLLVVGKNIEAQFREAELQRESENTLAYYYHTNQTDTMFLCLAQTMDALAGQEKRIEDQVNAGTRQVGTNLSAALLTQIKSAAAPDKMEAARRSQLAADVVRIQNDLDLIKARLGITNPPAARP